MISSLQSKEADLSSMAAVLMKDSAANNDDLAQKVNISYNLTHAVDMIPTNLIGPA